LLIPGTITGHILLIWRFSVDDLEKLLGFKEQIVLPKSSSFIE
jgi:hypothetical protein